MTSDRVKKINQMIEDIGKRCESYGAKKSTIELYQRMVGRLDSFSKECEQCEALLSDIEKETERLVDEEETLSKEKWKTYEESFATIRSHLEKEHQLVAKGYYQATYMSLGIGLGVLFGLTIFDNIGVGIGIGIALGVAIGVGKDAEVKKKGLVL